MKMIRSLLLALLASFAFCGQASATNTTWTTRTGTQGGALTFGAFAGCGGLCAANVPIDTSGTPLFTSTNAGYFKIMDAANNARGANVNASNQLSVSCDNGCSSSSAITGWAGGTLGAMANYGTSPGAVLVPGVNSFITNIPHVVCDSGCSGSGGTSSSFGSAMPSAGTAIGLYDGTNMVRYRGDETLGSWGNIKGWAGTALGAPSAYGTSPGAVNVPGVNAFVTNTNANGQAVSASSSPVVIATDQSAVPTTKASQYPLGAIAITASATGTTGATTATLAASGTGRVTYICSLSIRSNATAAATGNATVTGTVTGTLNFTHWTAPNASGIGITEQIYTPCVPGSAVNTGVAVISPAPGSGGTVSVTAAGYQL